MAKMKNIKNSLADTHLHDIKEQAIHLKHKVGKLENLVNPNHRHDEAHEKATDKKRAAIAESHRYESFAPERDGNNIKWYVDGRDYFWVCCTTLEYYQKRPLSDCTIRPSVLRWKGPKKQSTLRIGGFPPSW